MSSIAIIPARGGSKRIPRKNIKTFLGKPIIAYSIEVALKSGLFDEVMVSTDDQEIADIAIQYGAKVPFMRSKDAANDHATTMDALNEVLDCYKKEGKIFDHCCCIYATAPLVEVEDLVKGYEVLSKNAYDAVFPLVAFSYPIWRGFEITTDGKSQMLWKEHLNSRSQDLKPVYHDAGQWYWFAPSQVDDKLFTDNTSSIIISEDQVQDIDTETDWILAEMKYKLRNELD